MTTRLSSSRPVHQTAFFAASFRSSSAKIKTRITAPLPSSSPLSQLIQDRRPYFPEAHAVYAPCLVCLMPTSSRTNHAYVYSSQRRHSVPDLSLLFSGVCMWLVAFPHQVFCSPSSGHCCLSCLFGLLIGPNPASLLALGLLQCFQPLPCFSDLLLRSARLSYLSGRFLNVSLPELAFQGSSCNSLLHLPVCHVRAISLCSDYALHVTQADARPTQRGLDVDGSERREVRPQLLRLELAFRPRESSRREPQIASAATHRPAA
eukprot:4040738-Pleurochrysis_carterae.AAC.2